ncbi:unnamed protein product [Oppiella nova]|uniref:SGNH hydrolase-type esterase domain-containing protein n=1 Tax=Oppiella nova TaxID=334625 RepID=A0A7R9QQE6_9ACAR|nr:unnamed protein product [Oppiella nova]CAG2170020.1 unnamed protein product [Oppiella nova]
MSSDGLNRRKRVVNRNGDSNEDNMSSRVMSQEVSPESTQNQSILKRVMSLMALSMAILAMVYYYTTQSNDTKELVMTSVTQDIPWEPRARGNKFWVDRHHELIDQTVAHKTDAKIVFVGDSITHLWQSRGKVVWDKYYAARHAYNYGIRGDQTQHVIYRIQNQEFDGLYPRVTILMIGTNNAYGGNTVEDIAHGVNETVKQLLGKMPNTELILLGVLPRPEPLGAKVKQVNELIAKLNNDKNVFFLDMWSAYETDGKQHTELYVKDKLHLNEKGYEVWQQTMEPLLKKLDPTL